MVPADENEEGHLHVDVESEAGRNLGLLNSLPQVWWDKGFTISKKVKFKYKPMPPVEWYAPGTEPGLDEDY